MATNWSIAFKQGVKIGQGQMFQLVLSYIGI